MSLRRSPPIPGKLGLANRICVLPAHSPISATDDNATSLSLTESLLISTTPTFKI